MVFYEILSYYELGKIKQRVKWLEIYRFPTRNDSQPLGFMMGWLDSQNFKQCLHPAHHKRLLSLVLPRLLKALAHLFEE